MKVEQRHHHCRINEYTYRGHRLLVLENSLLKLSLLASKGADIVEFRYKPLDLDVLWHAPQGILPPGAQVPTTARQNGSFLDFYPGGWQEILPNPGHAVTLQGAELGQHGETALLPWDVRLLEDSPERISVEFSVRTIRTPFHLARRIELVKESSHISIYEDLTNEGEEDLSFGWGHHPCFGDPFLQGGCVVDLPAARAHSLEGGTHSRYESNQSSRTRELPGTNGKPMRVDRVPSRSDRTEDVIYFDELSAGWYALRNPQFELGFALQWDAALFPYLWSWQVYGGSFGYPYFGRAYTLGLEPFSVPPLPLLDSLEKGAGCRLSAGERIQTELFAGFFAGRKSVRHISGQFEIDFSPGDQAKT